jgi:glutathione synthase/RimK-type ligase-like ATP-grasp enzyme
MMTARLAILYEHPLWFEPLFAALDRRGIETLKIPLTDHAFDPVGSPPPAPVIFSRVAMSGFLREPEHPIFYAAALLDHWRRKGARVLNGPEVLAIDSSKARQLSLMASLGHAVPATRIVHRGRDLLAAASADMSFPLLVKANIGGSGAGIVRYNGREELARSIEAGSVPESIDKVLLLQDYVPARGGTILRLETLGGRFLYALEVATGASFDLCPADACMVQPGRSAITMRAVEPPTAIVRAAEDIAKAIGMDVGGVEVVIDDRDGCPRFYDINGLSNFVANPLEVLGWDPHERLVDMLQAIITEVTS